MMITLILMNLKAFKEKRRKIFQSFSTISHPIYQMMTLTFFFLYAIEIININEYKFNSILWVCWMISSEPFLIINIMDLEENS